MTDTRRVTWWREGWRVYRVAAPLFFTRRRLLVGAVAVVAAFLVVYVGASLLPIPDSALLPSDFVAGILALIAVALVMFGFGMAWFVRDNRTDGLTPGGMLPAELAGLQKAPPAAGESVTASDRDLVVRLARRQRRNYVAVLTMFMLVTVVQLVSMAFALQMPGSQLLWPFATVVLALAWQIWMLRSLALTSVLLENATGHRDPPDASAGA